ncbi:hypothetical protein ABZ801_34900 [Actinomadura sp. NPDC047616]|uniref:hypothetical protein n=1 Tax=Actinomadura sp. NPDC047616 TaxID=3155914 RepID=UPI0033EE33A3
MPNTTEADTTTTSRADSPADEPGATSHDMRGDEPGEKSTDTSGENPAAEPGDDPGGGRADKPAQKPARNDADMSGQKRAEDSEDEVVPGGRRRWIPWGADPVQVIAIVLTVVAAVAAGWFGWSRYAARHDDSLRYAATRDQVLRSAEQGVQNLSTLDYRSLDRSLKAWQESATGDLYRDIVQGRAQFEQRVREARTVTAAKVLEAAVTELDEHAGKARVLVAVQITVTPPEGEPAVKKSRLVGELTRTADGWKISGLGQAPIANP